MPPASGAEELHSLWNCVTLCMPEIDRAGLATFRAAGPQTLDADWLRWIEACWAPVLQPALCRQWQAAQRSDLKALGEEDERLGALLPPGERDRSLRGGRRLLVGYHPPAGARLLTRFIEQARAHPLRGHLVTAAALRAQIFQQPLLRVINAYLLAEARLGAEFSGHTPPADRIIAMMETARTCAPLSTTPELLQHAV